MYGPYWLTEVRRGIHQYDLEAPAFIAVQGHGTFPTLADLDSYERRLIESYCREGFVPSSHPEFQLMRGLEGICFERESQEQKDAELRAVSLMVELLRKARLTNG